ncbi:hypothetical protein EJ05DRAFT_525620 [Pseudovirgaria hyperparasitica]|uniref:Uncharacterized protein n=1 Tax=Pseudovirgaria hyperparasitica TaxID=470096 RepID=A0A6A6WF42_9PEZI|nr:uncharacterized protein EJ05DRAFT_525620 [Pseudovirgaria hyperparasitica]KAF2760506.1 hypothetical protein EJ05DRAFT_525620 [Pseudovirgaria hyperparasitica]
MDSRASTPLSDIDEAIIAAGDPSTKHESPAQGEREKGPGGKTPLVVASKDSKTQDAEEKNVLNRKFDYTEVDKKNILPDGFKRPKPPLRGDLVSGMASDKEVARSGTDEEKRWVERKNSRLTGQGSSSKRQ